MQVRTYTQMHSCTIQTNTLIMPTALASAEPDQLCHGSDNGYLWKMLMRPSASVEPVVWLFSSNVTVKVKTAGYAVLGLTACKAHSLGIVQLQAF